MLPARGPWEHPYHRIEDTFTNVSFVDVQGNERRVGVRQKVVGEGHPIVLVHGLMTSSYSWRYVLEPLARRYRVHALDLVGAGASDKPLDFEYSVVNVARFIEAYVASISKEPVYLVGNSLGGLYCLRMLLEDSAASHVRRFVMMHSPGYPALKTRLLSTALSVPGLGSALNGLVARVAHRWARTFVAKNVHYARSDMLSEEECAEYGRMFETLDGARAFAKILAESLDPSEHAEIIDQLRARKDAARPLPCPTRLFWAREDVMVPPEFGPLYHGDLPGSELVWFDDASHFIHVDAPDRVVDALLAFDGTARATAA